MKTVYFRQYKYVMSRRLEKFFIENLDNVPLFERPYDNSTSVISTHVENFWT